MLEPEPLNTEAAAKNTSVGLKSYLDDIGAVVRRVPATWVRCELHTLKVGERFVRMEFIEVDGDGKQIAKAQGGCWPAVWQRIDADFRAAGLTLEEGSQVLAKLQGSLNPTFGFQILVMDIDLTFALGDLNARMQSIRKHLQDAGIWGRNKSLPQPADFVRVSVIAPAGAAGLGDFRSTANRLSEAGLAEFVYHEVPFQTRDAAARIVDALRDVYRACNTDETRCCAVAIIRGGGASADLAWLVDQKLAEAVCRMNVPVMTGIGHERDRNLLDEVACIPCDTPSKVAEHISSTIIRAALDGERAQETIRAHAEQILNRHEAAVTFGWNAIDRDGRETVRLAEVAVRSAATSLEPGARAILDDMQAAVVSARTATDRDARETVRLAETKVRAAATGLEPRARGLLDETQATVAAVSEVTRAAARGRRELAEQAIRNLLRSITQTVEAAIRPVELGTGRALSEMRTRLDLLPRSAADQVVSVHRQIVGDANRSASLVGERIAGLREQAIQEAGRGLDGCQAAITIVRERANALHPRTVLAAGYAILRDQVGDPLTDVASVRAADLLTAEMRDGSTYLLNADSDHRGDEIK